MSFFKSKEEVIDIQLTPYGKKMLSNGKFIPKFYSFYDQDIIYDISSTDSTTAELQNTTQTRVMEETPYLKLQNYYVTSSRSDDMLDFNDNYLGLPLGATEDFEQKYPAFSISFLDGTIDNVQLTGSDILNTFGSDYVPQINLKEQTVDVMIRENYSNSIMGPDEFLALGPREDDSYVKIKNKRVTFELGIDNIEDLTKNFDIEVYKIEAGQAQLLNFEKGKGSMFEQIIVDDMLVAADASAKETTISDPALAENANFVEDDLKKVSSYFSFSFDQEIPRVAETPDRLFIYDPITTINPTKDNC